MTPRCLYCFQPIPTDFLAHSPSFDPERFCSENCQKAFDAMGRLMSELLTEPKFPSAPEPEEGRAYLSFEEAMKKEKK